MTGAQPSVTVNPQGSDTLYHDDPDVLDDPSRQRA
jgi:hypothetical protein